MTDRLREQEAQSGAPRMSLDELFEALQRREARLAKGFGDSVFHLGHASRMFSIGGKEGPEVGISPAATSVEGDHVDPGANPQKAREYINEVCRSFGITTSGDPSADAEAAHIRLDQLLDALRSGDFAVLAQQVTQEAVMRDRTYAPHIFKYLQTIKKIEEELAMRGGADTNVVLSELLEVSKLKLKVHGLTENDLIMPKNAHEAYLRGEHKALVDTQKCAAESLHPIIVIMKALKWAKHRLSLRQVGVKRESYKPEKVSESENMIRQEILGGIDALEKAMSMLQGGKVANVRAMIGKVVSELLGWKTHEEHVFVMKAGGRESAEDAETAILEAAQKHFLQGRNLAGGEVFVGTEKEVLKWALPKMRAARGEKEKPVEPTSPQEPQSPTA